MKEDCQLHAHVKRLQIEIALSISSHHLNVEHGHINFRSMEIFSNCTTTTKKWKVCPGISVKKLNVHYFPQRNWHELAWGEQKTGK